MLKIPRPQLHATRRLRACATNSRPRPRRSMNADGMVTSGIADDAVKGFDGAVRRAHEEGLDLFALAPQLTYRAMTPHLQPFHWKASGMVQRPVDAKRLDSCLAHDFFQRPSWSSSVVPAPAEEDRRTLETVARQRRVRATEDRLRKTATRSVCPSAGVRRQNEPPCESLAPTSPVAGRSS